MKKIKTKFGIIFYKKIKGEHCIFDSNKKEFLYLTSKDDLREFELCNNFNQLIEKVFPSPVVIADNVDTLIERINDSVKVHNDWNKEANMGYEDTPLITKDEILKSEGFNQMGDTYVFFLDYYL